MISEINSVISEDVVKNSERWACLLRYDTLRMISNAKSGHPGGCMSIAEIMACLYFHVMRIQPAEPEWPDRDRFILSKGHAAPILYAALARSGYFPVEKLKTLRKIGSFLHGHPDISAPGVDMTSGCLGEGLSAAVGMALAGRLDNRDYRTFVVMGCGEMNEGQLWEAAVSAAHFKLDTIVGIVDYNKLQFDGPLEEISGSSDVHARWKSIGWHVIDVDGHNVPDILAALEIANQTKGSPTVLIANTIKGKGVDFMENDYLWHSLMDIDQLKTFVESMKHELQCSEDGFYAQSLW